MKRNTVQRQIVLDALKKLNHHPAIDEIYAEIHTGHPSISKMTVYRNLRRLADKGVIRQVSLPDGLGRYDANIIRHHHFVCKNCGRIADIDTPDILGIDEAVRRQYGFDIDKHDIVFSGTCSQCKAVK